MVDLMSYAEKNDVEVSVRKGHDGRTVWELFLRDRRLGVTEFTRIIDIELRGRMNKDAYMEMRLESMMDHIRGERMRRNYADIEGTQLSGAVKHSSVTPQSEENRQQQNTGHSGAGELSENHDAKIAENIRRKAA